MMNIWQLQEAKARFSELIRKATFEGPQKVTVRGEEQVVIMSKKTFDQLTKPKLNFWDLMQDSPLKNVEIEFKREDSFSRDIEL